MKVFNVRAGFATNSSSSHSIVMIPAGMRVTTDEYNRFEYGWEQFTLADRESKSAYFATQLYHALERESVSGDTAVQLMNSWLGTDYSGDSFASWGVDHQSIWGIFSGPDPVNGDFARTIYQYVMRDDVVILGGNDNSEGQTPPTGSFGNEVTDAIQSYGERRVRQDGSYWTLFSPSSGHKVRLSMDDSAPDYVKSTYPELVDVKLTDYCAYGCEFCFVPGTPILTPSGTAPIEQLKAGDIVFTYNLDTQSLETLPIAETYKRDYVGDLIEIELENGQSLTVTPNHEIYVKGRGWVRADECEENDEILDIKQAC